MQLKKCDCTDGSDKALNQEEQGSKPQTAIKQILVAVALLTYSISVSERRVLKQDLYPLEILNRPERFLCFWWWAVLLDMCVNRVLDTA
jgi:hypothetical protein